MNDIYGHVLVNVKNISLLDSMWVLLSSILVIFMTIPGLSLFYGGLVRKKNVISILMKSFSICSIVSVSWIFIGYSLAFSPGNMFIGNLSKLALHDMLLIPNSSNLISVSYNAPNIPESVYILYSLAFAIIAPALITGGFAERMKFISCIIFTLFWSLAVYAPIAHMVWDTHGWLHHADVIDFAGGTVVHITSGVAGLVAAIMLGKRDGLSSKTSQPILPYNLVFSFIGASILWIGWFGFNGGSTYAFNMQSILAILNTQLAAASGALAWMIVESIKGRPSAIGAASGAIAGLVAITPAAGFVHPHHAIIMGLAAGGICYVSCSSVKLFFGYDDALDAFGIHGVGGIIGGILTGFFADKALVGFTPSVMAQFKGIIFTIIYTAVATIILLKLVDLIIGLRVTKSTEDIGLDVVQHGSGVNQE